MSTEIVNFEEQLAALAKQEVAKEKPVGSSISFKSGIMAYNSTPIPGNKLEAIIIASTHANLYYEGDYDADNLMSPVCYAYGDTEADMVPDPAATKPQSATCRECPHNQFGTSNKGSKKGKACKNSRHLALIPAGTTPEDLPTVEIAVAKLPVSSVKGYSQYVHRVGAQYNRPPLGVVTEISVTPDIKTQFKVNFNALSLVSSELLGGLLAKMGEGAGLLRRVYDPNVDAPAAPVEGKKKGKF